LRTVSAQMGRDYYMAHKERPSYLSPSPSSAVQPDPGSRIRILLVEDHQLVRQGIKHLLSFKSRFEICGEAETGAAALKIVQDERPELALVDINLKATNGIELTREIRLLSPRTQVLVVSMHGENVYAERALRAGAMGYLMKDEPTDNIITAIDTILRGEIFLSERIKGRLLQRFVDNPADALMSPIDRLSDRELEVMRLLGVGYGTREIAELLKLSVKTIDSYREHLKDKMNFPNGAELVRYAVQWVKSESPAPGATKNNRTAHSENPFSSDLSVAMK
jgi:DNA-binding NarL/FixJ family response regulator